MSMVKLIHSSSFDPAIGVGAELITRQGELHKQASTIFGMDYDALKPDDKSVGIHVVALGDSDHYPMNRNGDLFPKEACVKYHDTFVKHGHVFRHHRNKDPEKAIGIIKASAYNEPMGRVELFIHADKEKAAPELARLEKEGEIPFSMACRIEKDRCTICGNLRKQAGGPDECEHVRNHLGEVWDDGRMVGTYNDTPQWFDISFVGRPADRIAWNLKVASALDLDSVKAAEYEGVTAPDDLACDTEASRRKLGYLKDIDELQTGYLNWICKNASVRTARDMYLMKLFKTAANTPQLDDAIISRLREQPVRSAMHALASNGIVMDVPTFFKYATGDDYEMVVKPYIDGVKKVVPHLVRQRVKEANCASLCTCRTYDAADGSHLPSRLSAVLSKRALDLRGAMFDEAASGASSIFKVASDSTVCYNDGVTEKLAEAYLSYQLSAIDAVVNSRRGLTKLDAEALAAASNLKLTP